MEVLRMSGSDGDGPPPTRSRRGGAVQVLAGVGRWAVVISPGCKRRLSSVMGDDRSIRRLYTGNPGTSSNSSPVSFTFFFIFPFFNEARKLRLLLQAIWKTISSCSWLQCHYLDLVTVYSWCGWASLTASYSVSTYGVTPHLHFTVG